MTALTLGEMHQLRWKLIATCSCGLAMRASVPMLIRVHGPDAVWWGVHPPCPSLKMVAAAKIAWRPDRT